MPRDQFAENVADALAARRTSQVSGSIAVAWIGVGTVTAAFLGHVVHPAGWAGAVVGFVFLAIAIVMLRIHRIRALADPLPLRVGASDGWGMSTDRSTYLSWAMVTLILTAVLVMYWGALPPSGRWGLALFGLGLVAMLVSTGLPGILIRRRKWELLDETLRANSEASAKYAQYRRETTGYHHRPPGL